MKQSESRIQATIFQWHWNTYPEERGRFFMVNNNPENAIDGNRLKAIGLVKGVSDMCFICGSGVTAYIEVKTEDGRQSESQKKFQSICESVGAPYYLIRSVEEGMELINKLR